MDDFVQGFHDAFGIPQNGRDEFDNRLLYKYSRDGDVELDISHANGGFGDIRLSGAFQLHGGDPANTSAVALHGSIKLPTGKSEEYPRQRQHRFLPMAHRGPRFTIHRQPPDALWRNGGMGLTTGDVLSDQQRNLAAFGTVGLGWSPYKSLGLKLQFDANTPFYKDSYLHELCVFLNPDGVGCYLCLYQGYSSGYRLFRRLYRQYYFARFRIQPRSPHSLLVRCADGCETPGCSRDRMFSARGPTTEITASIFSAAILAIRSPGSIDLLDLVLRVHLSHGERIPCGLRCPGPRLRPRIGSRQVAA